MTKNKKKKKKHLLFYKILSFIFIIITVITNAVFIYKETFSDIELLIIGLLSIFLSFAITIIIGNKNVKKWIKNIISFIAILTMIIEILFMIYGVNTFDLLKKITDNGTREEEIGIYVLSSSTYNEIKDLNNKSFEYLNLDDDTNIRKSITKFEEKIDFTYDYVDDIETILNDLSEEKVDAIIIPTTYEDIISEDYPDIYENIKMIYSVSIKSVVNVISSDKDITKDPFVIYISGIDTSGKIASKARSDVNILLAINPKTGKVLMINTPRDYYVTFHTKGVKDKLTHAGVFGVEESLMTLEDFYNVDIDYYVRINFTSFVKIVNALGGITVDVEGSFCEQNSKRDKSATGKICLSKGKQTLNGEQALAYARNRHAFSRGDRSRGEHQMQIIEAIINKVMSPKILTTYNSLISSLNGQVSTNMTSDEMISFAKKQLKKSSNWSFESYSVDGTGSKNKCNAVRAGNAYVMEPNMETVTVARNALQNILNGKSKLVVVTTTTTSTATSKTTTKRVSY